MLPPPLLFSLSVLLLCVAAASPPPFPFDSFLVHAPSSHLLTDVDAPGLVLEDAWAAPDAGRFSPLGGLLPDAPVKLQVSRARAEELMAALAHSSFGVFLFIRTCVRLLDDAPVLPTAVTPIGAHPTSFFPPSLLSNADADGDGDGSICFTSIDLPLEDALGPNMMLKCTGHAHHDTCGYTSEQLQRLHLTATLDSESAPPLLLHRIYAARSTLYARGDGLASSQSVRLQRSAFLLLAMPSTCNLITCAAAAAQRGRALHLPQHRALRVSGAGRRLVQRLPSRTHTRGFIACAVEIQSSFQ